MATSAWTWAALSNAQLMMVNEAEKTLGDNVSYVIAFQPGNAPGIMGIPQNGLKVSRLNASQVECLQGLEQKLSVVAIAYQ